LKKRDVDETFNVRKSGRDHHACNARRSLSQEEEKKRRRRKSKRRPLIHLILSQQHRYPHRTAQSTVSPTGYQSVNNQGPTIHQSPEDDEDQKESKAASRPERTQITKVYCHEEV